MSRIIDKSDFRILEYTDRSVFHIQMKHIKRILGIKLYESWEVMYNYEDIIEFEDIIMARDFIRKEIEKRKPKKPPIIHTLTKLHQPDVSGRSEQIKAFADYAQKRMWEDGDKDLSEFVDEFLCL